MKCVVRFIPLVAFVFLFLTVRPSEHRLTRGAKQEVSEQPLPAGVSSDWWSQVQEEIRREEMQATMQETDSEGQPFESPRWHVVNRGGGFRAYGNEEGVEFRPREDASWRVRMTLVGPRADEVKGEGERIVWERGTTQEWLENRAEGLEHGFTVREGSAAPFDLVLAVTTEGAHVSAADEQHLIFSDDSRDVMEYRDLKVVDATGKELASRMEWTNGQLALRVLEAGEYPIMVDPLAASPAWTKTGDEAGAQFGFSVATAGDVNGDGFNDVIVGAPYYDYGRTNQGRVFVYHGSTSGLSTTSRWNAIGSQEDAEFGFSVATAGDVDGDGFSDVIIGAPRFGRNGNAFDDAGKVFVYQGSGSGLDSTSEWSATGVQDDERLGYSVSTAGDVNGDGYSDVIIGAPFYNFGSEGRAVAYYGSPSGLPQQNDPNRTMEQGQSWKKFGWSVSTAGDVNGDGYADVIVGGPGHNQVFVYHGSSAGLPATESWWVGIDQADSDFGYCVSTAGDTNGDGYSDILVGAPRYDNHNEDEGIVYRYMGGPGGLSSTSFYVTDGGQPGAMCGRAVSTAGDVNGDGYADVLVGIPLYDHQSVTDRGRVLLFEGRSWGLESEQGWQALGAQAGEQLGFSLCTAGDVNGDGFSDVIIGAPLYDNSGLTDRGKVLVYYGGPSINLSPTGSPSTGPTQAGAQFGYSLSTAGDVNGDGYADVIIGAPHYDNGQTDEGRVLVYHGSSRAQWLGTPAWSRESNQASSYFGSSVSAAGDVNGDGYSDVIIGAPNYDNGQSNEGRAYVYFGSDNGLGTTPWTAESNQGDSYFGKAVATAGDVDGNGYSDIIVGAPLYDNGQSNEGCAFIYYGSSLGLPSGASLTLEVNQAFASFGSSVASAGDVNADGYSDVIVGAPAYNSNKGRVYVYHGSSSGLPTGASKVLTGSNMPNALFGTSAASAGDVNGDGYSDLIVGEHGYDSSRGRVYVFAGSASGLRNGNGEFWYSEGFQAGSWFGRSVSTAGDINGDGCSDLLMGAPGFDANGRFNVGRVYIFRGSRAESILDALWPAGGSTGDQAGGNLGYSVAPAGDFNGDGFSDFLAGAPWYDSLSPSATDSGLVSLFHGNGSVVGIAIQPQQAKGDGTPMQLLGDSNDDTFRARVFARVPAGSTRVRLQVQVEPIRTLFDPNLGNTLMNGDWTHIPPGGGDIDKLVDGLNSNTPYHWRARLQYFPHMTYGKWFSIGPNGANETDFRTP